jgi:pyridoxamine 5'-phosphate oxidase family protein
MRLFAILLVIVILALAAWSVYQLTVGQATRRLVSQRRQASWRFRHYTRDGDTVVTVSKVVPGTDEVLEEQVLNRFPVTDPNWEELFLSAQLEAEQRAFHLNAGGSLSEPGA